MIQSEIIFLAIELFTVLIAIIKVSTRLSARITRIECKLEEIDEKLNSW